jgi:predicted RNA binding protein YcfA (HicA-like mRNA interferase family)
MARWGAAKARRVLAALLRIGWTVTEKEGSHRRLERDGWEPYTATLTS